MVTVAIETADKANYRLRESYKNLRTNILLSGKENKVIMFTSCTPSEGKSTVSLNTAAELARAGKKVLFIDCDLRKSVLAGRHRVKKGTKGFTHYLAGQNRLEEVKCQTNIDGLEVIFSGPTPPNPSELLGLNLFKYTIQTVRESYDYVIVDTPPLGNVIDAAVVAQACDAAVVVIAANEISYKFAQNTVDQLKKTNINIIGTVLNKVDLSENGYYGKYYGKYYDKYYGKYEHKEEA